MPVIRSQGDECGDQTVRHKRRAEVRYHYQIVPHALTRGLIHVVAKKVKNNGVEIGNYHIYYSAMNGSIACQNVRMTSTT